MHVKNAFTSTPRQRLTYKRPFSISHKGHTFEFEIASSVANQLSWRGPAGGLLQSNASAYTEKSRLAQLRSDAKRAVLNLQLSLAQRDINRCAELASLVAFCDAKGGKLKSGKHCDSSRIELSVDCGKGHVFEMESRRIYEGQWCKDCRLIWNRGTFEKICESRNCVLLSDFKNMETRTVTVLCNKCNDDWDVNPKNFVYKESGCPSCKNWFEARVRRILEKRMGIDLSSSRPPWLRGIRGGQMQLDGFNQDACLALEVQGPHHYGRSTTTRGQEIPRDKLEIIAENDGKKALTCYGRGVFILEIRWLKNVFGERLLAHVEDTVRAEVEHCKYASERRYKEGQNELGDSFATAAQYLQRVIN
jgi:hypothetical protein